MNILVLSHMFPKNELDNNGIFVYEQCRHLSKIGCNIKVISPIPFVPPLFNYFKEKWRRYINAPRKHTFGKVQAIYPRYIRPPGSFFFPFSPFFMFISVFLVLRRIKSTWKIDIIHAHAVMPDGLVAYLLSKLLKIPIVCTLHGGDINVYPFYNKLSYIFTKISLNKISHIVAVSNNLAQRALTIIAKEKTIHVLRNGADKNKFYLKDKYKCREKLNIPYESKIVMFIGNLNRDKGAHLLPQILDKILDRKSVV